MLVLILLTAFGLRLYRLADKEVWYDEAFAVLYAEKELGAIVHGTVTSVEGAAADIHPLMYYFFLHGWMCIDQSPLVVRFPSVVFGLVALCMVFAISRELFNPRIGLAATALGAASPFHIWYSQEARMYSLLCLTSLLVIYFFVRAWKKGTRLQWIGLSFFTALSLYAHNLAFLILLTLYLFVVVRQRWSFLGRLLLAHVGSLLLFLPWLLLVPGQLAKVRQAYWIPKPGPVELVRTLIVFTFNLPLPDWLLPISLFFSLLLLAMVLYRSLSTAPVARSEATWPVWLCLSLSFVPMVAMFVISLLKPVYIERAVLSSALIYCIAVAQAMLRGRVPRIALLSLMPIPLLLVGSLWFQYHYSGFPRSPFRQANAYLKEHVEAGDVIVHDSKLSFFPSHYYDRTLSQEYVGDAPGSSTDTLALPTQEVLGLLAQPDMDHAAGDAEHVWFVVFQRALDEATELGVENESKTWLDSRYRLTSVETFNDLLVYRYEAP
jgi:mannosyltransferase